jgi:hypothetical protein
MILPMQQNMFLSIERFFFFYFPLLGTLGGSRKKMAKDIIPEVATSKNV